jgi:hypothetical protein
MRNECVLTALLLCASVPAQALSFSFGSSDFSIGFNVPSYPELVPIPGYPAYYAPNLDANYFFYDGMYWIFRDDNWYASTWYDGPWGRVDEFDVPLYVLRIPVRYYRRPPSYFSSWTIDRAPRWGEHYGNAWAQRRLGWDRYARSKVPRRPPLPAYQRGYSGQRYPNAQEQNNLHRRNYTYRPQTQAVRQGYLQLQNLRTQQLQNEQRRVQDERNQQRENRDRDEQNRRANEQRAQTQEQERQRQERDRSAQQRRDSEQRTQNQRQQQQRQNSEWDAQNRREGEQRAQSLRDNQQRQSAERDAQSRRDSQQRQQIQRDSQERARSLNTAQSRRDSAQHAQNQQQIQQVLERQKQQREAAERTAQQRRDDDKKRQDEATRQNKAHPETTPATDPRLEQRRAH